MRRLLATLALAGALAAAQRVPRPQDLKYPPLKQVTVPEPAQFTLSNGMRVFLLENHELPLIRGFALVRTGNLFDPPDKRGLSQVMAEVMRSGGTSAKTGDQLDEELENIAASVESSMGETSATVSFSALKETAAQALAVFRDVMADPEFRQDKIDLALNQLRGAIARRNDEASEIPTRELLSILYGRDNSYGWTIEYEHLDNIRRQDLIDFHARYYFPANIMLAVYGDFATADMRARLEQLFGGWTVTQPPVPPFPPVTAQPAPGIYFAAKPDVTQTFFSIGHLGGTLRDPDYPALEVMANILGAGFSSRLVTQVRTRLGYAYSIGAAWSANYNHPGMFRIAGSTKSMSTVAALKAIRAELDKLRTEEVTQKELDEAKQAVLNSFVFFFDSPAKTLNRVMQYEYFGYPKDFLFQYQKAVEAVTRADVLRVAKTHLHPEWLTIVAVGNPAELGTPLTELGEVQELDLTIPQPKSKLSQADAASLARGKALLERAQQALGGAEALAAIRDMTVVAELKTTPAQGGFTVKLTAQIIGSEHLRQEQELPFGRVIVYSDGKSGWISTPQGVQNMPAEVVAQVQGELFRQFPGLFLSDRIAGRTVNAVGENAVEISGSGQAVRVEFDAAGLPVRLIYREGGMEVTETWSDWREVNGVRLPFSNSLPSGQVTVGEFRFNTGLTPDALSKRP
jgi:zinc protease